MHQVKNCPYCAEQIHFDAIKCKHCGEYLEKIHTSNAYATVPIAHQEWNPGLAALFSFLLPGAGQLYKGQIGAGIAWFVITVMAYFFIFPGLILHLVCIISAATGDPYRKY